MLPALWERLAHSFKRLVERHFNLETETTVNYLKGILSYHVLYMVYLLNLAEATIREVLNGMEDVLW